MPGRPAAPGRGASSYQEAQYRRAADPLAGAGGRGQACRDRSDEGRILRWARSLRLTVPANGLTGQRAATLALDCSLAASTITGLVNQAGSGFGGKVVLVSGMADSRRHASHGRTGRGRCDRSDLARAPLRGVERCPAKSPGRRRFVRCRPRPGGHGPPRSITSSQRRSAGAWCLKPIPARHCSRTTTRPWARPRLGSSTHSSRTSAGPRRHRHHQRLRLDAGKCTSQPGAVAGACGGSGRLPGGERHRTIIWSW